LGGGDGRGGRGRRRGKEGMGYALHMNVVAAINTSPPQHASQSALRGREKRVERRLALASNDPLLRANRDGTGAEML